MTGLRVDELDMHPQAGLDNELGASSTLVVALLLALAAHLFVIFGVAFELPKPPPRPVSDTIDIIVVNPVSPSPQPETNLEPSTDTTTEDSDGGLADPIQQPRANADELAVPEPDEVASPPIAPDAIEEIEEPPLDPSTIVPEEAPADPERTLVTALTPPEQQEPIEPKPPAPVPPPPLLEPEPPPRVTAAQILASRDSEIARLSARIDARSSVFGKSQRRKAINASTREIKYANYLEAWRKKVERIGNLNYPQEAKRKGLFGNLILHVALRSDGSIETLRIARSSGHPMLDEAAMDIVSLAAPFAPFPADIRSETDVLDITRTWQFLRGNRFSW